MTHTRGHSFRIRLTWRCLLQLRTLVVIASAWGVAGTALAVPAPPRLVVERGGAGQRLLVEVDTAEGQRVRQVLKEDARTVRAGGRRLGSDGGGRLRDLDARGVTAAGPPAAATRAGPGPRRRPRAPRSSCGGRRRAGAADAGRSRPRLPCPPTGRLFLVQFRTMGLPEWRQALADLGAEVLSFFPHNAHIVRMDPALVLAVAQLAIVERVEPYHPAYRLEPELRDWALAPRDRSPRRVQVMAFAWGPDGKSRILAAARPWARGWPRGTRAGTSSSCGLTPTSCCAWPRTTR